MAKRILLKEAFIFTPSQAIKDDLFPLEGAMKIKTAILFFLLAVPAFSQEWKKEEKTDPLRETRFLQFSLEGKYLRPPSKAAELTSPLMVIRCAPGRFAFGHARGKFLEGYVVVGGVVDSNMQGVREGLNVQFRLDDRKLQAGQWSHSTDFSALFFSDMTFNNLLYGHLLPHKENTGPQVYKVVIGASEFLGGEVVMQFDMPDATEVADACGVIWHKQKQ